jgi:hypothetical protein
MIKKINLILLLAVEHFKFMSSVCAIFEKLKVANDTVVALLAGLKQYVADAETALAHEKRNAKIREKNEADLVRDRLHSKLFNYLKTILYDPTDERFDDAQTVMKVVKNVGNPNRLPENVQSATLITLGNKLAPVAAQIAAIGAAKMVEDLTAANRRFIEAERDAREETVNLRANKPPTMGELRKQADPAYRAIVDIINAYANVPENRETWKNVMDEMNVLIARYEQTLAARKRSK